MNIKTPEPHSHYYLQQMGIELWVQRLAPMVDKQRVKLMIVGEALDDSNKSAALLTKMLMSIGISRDDVCVKSTDNLTQHITTIAPQALLIMGRRAHALVLNASQNDYHGVPFVASKHPNDLLAHPSDKKNAYQDLLRVQQLIECSVN